MKHRLFLCCLLFITYSFSAAAQGIITTVAGGGSGGSGGLATQAALFGPNDVVVDDTGNIYIAEDYFLWKVDVNGIIHLLGGDGNPGVGGDGIHVSQSRFGGATSIAFDKNGDLFIADAGNHAIRKVDKNTGIITKVVGDWTLGYAGDGGPANSAKLKYPHAIAFDAAGNLYIADLEYVIRKVDVQTGIISTVAGNGVQGTWKNGDTATKAQLGGLAGLCLDKFGNIYFADFNNHKIGLINSLGILSTYCGTGGLGNSGDGGLAINAQIIAAGKIKADRYNNIFLSDGTVRKIDAITNIINLVAGPGSGFCGDGGSATQACLAGPRSTHIDTNGNFYIADHFNYRIRKVTYPTNINSPTKKFEYKLYPNPSKGVFIVETLNNDIKRIEIYNMIGQNVHAQLVYNRTTEVNISRYPADIYIIKLFGLNGHSSQRIQVIH